MPATYDDANVMMQIVRWTAEANLEEAMSVIWDESFDPDTASVSERPVGRVLGFGELVGTFVKQGVLMRSFA